MSLYFENPLVLLLIPLVLVLVYRVRNTTRAFRSIWRACCLGGTGIGLVLSISAPVVVQKSSTEHRILLVDASSSARPPASRIPSLARTASSGLEPGDRFSLLVFGESGVWVVKRIQPSGFRNLQRKYQNSLNQINGDHTHLLRATRNVLREVGSDETTSVLLVSDGQFNQKELRRAVYRFQQARIPVHTLSSRTSSRRDVWIDQVTTPHRIQPDTPFEVSVTLRATGAYRGTVVVRDRKNPERVNITREINIRANRKRTLRFRVPPGNRAYQTYEIVLKTEQREWTKTNNRMEVGVQLANQYNVLWLGMKDGNRYESVAKQMETDRIDIQLRDQPTRIHPFDAFILAGSRKQVSSAWVRQVRRSVQKQGNGLIMIGNEQTFAVGRWGKTPVEQALPVQMYPPDAFAISFVFDVSGSMGKPPTGARDTTKLSVAKTALLGSIGYLNPSDRVQLITFARSTETVFPFQKISNGARFQRTIEGLSAGGGTHLQPAVSSAIDTLSEHPSPRKHLIVFSDARLDESTEHLRETGERAKENGIRIIVIATGREGKRPLLETLTRDGTNGRIIYLDSIMEFENQLRAELKRIRKLINSEGSSVSYHSSEKLSFVPDEKASLPERTGPYHRVTPKPSASTPLVTPEGEALVSGWTHGEGESVAIMPYLPMGPNQASADRKKWRQIFSSALFSVLPTSSGNWEIQSELTEEQLVLYARQRTDKFKLDNISIEGTLFREGKRMAHTSGTVIGPGRIQFTFERPDHGTYQFRSKIRKNGRNVRIPTGSVSVPFPEEYLQATLRTDSLRRVSEKTGGTYLQDQNDPVPTPKGTFQKGKRTIPLQMYALMGAMCFLLLLPIRY